MALPQDSPISKSVTIPDGTTYGYVHIQAQPSNPTFLLLHGFPSASYDWRHQIQGLKELGFGVIVPDLLGYGGTDKPLDHAKYAWKPMAAHIAALLKSEHLDKVIGVAHDWGCALLSRLWNYYPELFLGLVFVSVPYMDPATPLDYREFNKLTEQLFGYAAYAYWDFLNEDGADETINQNHDSLTSLYYLAAPEVQRDVMCFPNQTKEWFQSKKTVAQLPVWLSEHELSTHTEILNRGGYTAALNWYKSVIAGDNNPDDAGIPEDRRAVTVPTIFVVSDRDYVTRAEVAQEVARSGQLTQVEVKNVGICGHWIQLEKKDEFLDILREFAQKY